MASLKQFLNDKSNKSEVDQYFEDQAKFLIEKKKLDVIDNFNGYFDFLNNEYPCPVYYEGLIYKSVLHAFQAARSQEQHIREKIVRADTVTEMYEIAAKIDDPPDWLKIRLKVMETLIRDKFRRSSDLREKLRATETRSLINTYSDASTSNLFWGMVEGKGQNQVGRILESLRNDIHHNIELEKWLFMTFKLEENKNLLPKVQLNVFKGENQVETFPLNEKSYYFMGKLTGSDVMMAHQSVSRRHAVLICDSEMGVCIIDLGSKGGSGLNAKKIDHCVPYRLKPGDVLNFGASTRTYKVAIDYLDVERYLNRKQREAKKQAELMDTLNNPSANPDLIKATLGVMVNDQVFVAGIPDNCSHKELEQLFSQFGEIKQVTIPLDRKTGKTRNFALITFKDPKDCEKAVNSEGLKLKDKRLKVRPAEKRGYEDERPQENREKYAKAVRDNEGKLDKDVERRHRRRSRSPRDSRRRRDKDERSKKRDRSREKRREKKKGRSKSKSSSKSSSSGESQSKSKSRDKEKHKPVEKEKEKAKEKVKDREEKQDENKNTNKNNSRSRSRSKSKGRTKKNNKNEDSRKRRSRTPEKKDDKNKSQKKKGGKDESASESKSSSDDESGASSDDSDDKKKKK